MTVATAMSDNLSFGCADAIDNLLSVQGFRRRPPPRRPRIDQTSCRDCNVLQGDDRQRAEHRARKRLATHVQPHEQLQLHEQLAKSTSWIASSMAGHRAKPRWDRVPPDINNRDIHVSPMVRSARPPCPTFVGPPQITSRVFWRYMAEHVYRPYPREGGAHHVNDALRRAQTGLSRARLPPRPSPRYHVPHALVRRPR